MAKKTKSLATGTVAFAPPLLGPLAGALAAAGARQLAARYGPGAVGAAAAWAANRLLFAPPTLHRAFAQGFVFTPCGIAPCSSAPISRFRWNPPGLPVCCVGSSSDPGTDIGPLTGNISSFRTFGKIGSTWYQSGSFGASSPRPPYKVGWSYVIDPTVTAPQLDPVYGPMIDPNLVKVGPVTLPLDWPGIAPADRPAGPDTPFPFPGVPLPVPWVTPSGVPYPTPPLVMTVTPAPLGQGGTSPAPRLRPGAKPAPGQRPLPPLPPAPPAGSKPPRKGDKEAPKQRAASNRIAVAIFKSLDRISEASEVVDAVYQALPKKVRDRWDCDGKKGRQFIDSGGQYGIDHADCKAAAIYNNVHKIDVDQAIKNIVANEIQDQIYGKIYKRLPRNVGHAVDGGMKQVNDVIEWLTSPLASNGD